MLRGPSRREIGHGNLAERALSIWPCQLKTIFHTQYESFLRYFESNGSSSMATVCSSCLSLMDAGVPIKESVAGIAMGLVKDGDREIILSDILGMKTISKDSVDFKIAGSKTALQQSRWI